MTTAWDAGPCIENVAVALAFQERGLGRTLLTHVEQVVASLGLWVIKLYTNKLFAENLRFYQKLGYAVDQEEEFRGGFVVHMSKPVQACGQNSRLASSPLATFICRIRSIPGE